MFFFSGSLASYSVGGSLESTIQKLCKRVASHKRSRCKAESSFRLLTVKRSFNCSVVFVGRLTLEKGLSRVHFLFQVLLLCSNPYIQRSIPAKE